MRQKMTMALIMLMSFFSGACWGGEISKPIWLEGNYKSTGSGLLNDLRLCADGKAVVEEVLRATYTTVGGDEGLWVILSSNGSFTFIVSEDRKTLTPADEFTKEWGNNGILVQDESNTEGCSY